MTSAMKNCIWDWDVLNTRIVHCRQCARLTEWREKMALEKRRAYRDWEYWGKPVPGFGDKKARVLVIGLAPGAHGSNRTGRMFTGDSSGDFLYAALHRAGFANQPSASDLNDGLKLRDIFISAVCRCAPPDNKPTTSEISTCAPFLHSEICLLKNLEGLVVLGRIAFDWVMNYYRVQAKPLPPVQFSHGVYSSLGEGLPWLITSYHPSRQNTQTGRLTVDMVDAVWEKSRRLLDDRHDLCTEL